jgi:hypothetical protein
MVAASDDNSAVSVGDLVGYCVDEQVVGGVRPGGAQ